MVYIGNIFKAHEDLTEEEEILLNFGGGLNQIQIWAEDTVEKANGDLKIYRKINNNIIFVDCAEVKNIIIHRRFL